MGGRSSKDKGTGYEREILKKFASREIISERTWGSNGASRGLHKEVDIVLSPQYRWESEEYGQAKRPKSIPIYIKPPEGVCFLLYCKRRKRKFVAMRLNDYAEWYKNGTRDFRMVSLTPPNGVGKGYIPTDAVMFQIFRQDRDTKGDVVVLRYEDFEQL